MSDQKLENLLNISLQATPWEREKSEDLNVGYNEADQTWELIVKYNGDLDALQEKYPGIQIRKLLNQYGIIIAPREYIEPISQEDIIQYVEKPKRLFFAMEQEKAAACINPLQQGENNPFLLFGKGVLTAVIDTGIDIFDPLFRTPEGRTKISWIWDQTFAGEEEDSPYDYRLGREYDEAQINEALEQRIPLAVDVSGHGTSVAAIVCGNEGVAPQSTIMIVKLGISPQNSFPRTTQLMMALDYVVKKSQELSMPVAINLSFGNNYGSHRGTSLLESFMNELALVGQNVICVGAGNEASGITHKGGILKDDRELLIEFAVSPNETFLNLQLWKYYWDEVEVELIDPSGRVAGPLVRGGEVSRFAMGRTMVLGYLGQPSPYSVMQELYFDFIPMQDYVQSGIWSLKMTPVRLASGRFDLWLPAASSLNSGTGFLEPDSNLTFTIPSTASRVISVGAYNSYTNAYAAFSGRGYVAQDEGISFSKPDLCAPGVNVVIRPQTQVTGTSFAVGFVTGGAALLMEWGIVQGNDPYLFGEKVKAYLIKGARQLPGEPTPSPRTGYGALCVAASFPI